MIYFCTLFDKKYLLKGLTLHKNLCDHVKEDFKLFILCLDEHTYDTVKSLNLPHVELYLLAHLEEMDNDLIHAANLPPSQYGTQYENYCWRLTPYFINYALKKIPKGEKLTYLDSDIYFYSSPKVILDAMGSKSVGIHTHRFTAPFDVNSNPVGEFNVGVVVFTNNELGVKMSDEWKYWLLDNNNPYHRLYGTCGDQKYLCLFEPLLGADNVCVFDREASILHAAPWCTHGLEGKEVLFYHFAHFNIIDGAWKDNLKNEWNPSASPLIRKLYEQYFAEMVELSVNYKIAL